MNTKPKDEKCLEHRKNASLLAEINYELHSSTAPSRRTISVEEKLKGLIKKYPKRKFYQSLVRQMQKYPLTPKQTSIVELDYWKGFKKV